MTEEQKEEMKEEDYVFHAVFMESTEVMCPCCERPINIAYNQQPGLWKMLCPSCEDFVFNVFVRDDNHKMPDGYRIVIADHTASYYKDSEIAGKSELLFEIVRFDWPRPNWWVADDLSIEDMGIINKSLMARFCKQYNL